MRASTLALCAIALSSSALLACAAEPADDAGDPAMSVAEGALTAAQCDYFDIDGKVQICHHTSSFTNPYVIIRVAEAGCINGHVGHDGDYVAVGDPTCKGGGCLPDSAPCDKTLRCCDGLACVDGECRKLNDCTADAPPTNQEPLRLVQELGGPVDAVFANATTLYVADLNVGLVKVDLAANKADAVFQTKSAGGVARDANGGIYINDSLSGAVLKYDPVLAKTTEVVKLDGGPSGMTIGPDKRLYVAMRDSGKVLAVNTETKEIKEIAAYNSASDVAFDTTGNMYVTDVKEGILWKQDALTAEQTKFGVDLKQPTAVTLDANGYAYVAANDSSGTLTRFAPGGAKCPFGKAPTDDGLRAGLLFDATNHLVVTDVVSRAVLQL